MIRNNRHKYSASVMCEVLQIPRSTYYYEAKARNTKEEEELTKLIVGIFHTNRRVFGQRKIKKILQRKGWQVSHRRIGRSLSNKGTPYDNAVAEATFKSIKTEFINGTVFSSQVELDLELFDYVNWFNNIRIHESLDYLTPREFKLQHQLVD